MVYLKSVENVKLIGLLFLFCLPLLSILFLKTKMNDLARPVMGTIFLVLERHGDKTLFHNCTPNHLFLEQQRFCDNSAVFNYSPCQCSNKSSQHTPMTCRSIGISMVFEIPSNLHALVM